MRLHLAAALPLIATLLTATLHAQWEMQDPHVTADLRGIAYVGNGVAWASGSHGTVLRTEDMGFVWQLCATPPDAKDLDFRGVQAFDNNTAIVMASGPGDKSRLYKTTDGCQTWTQVLMNPYAPDGFFDALLFIDRQHGILLSDPVPTDQAVEYRGDFRMRITADGGTTWAAVNAPDIAHAGSGLHPLNDEAAFAASNSSMAVKDGWFWFATSKARVSRRQLLKPGASLQFLFEAGPCAGTRDPVSGQCGHPWVDFRDTVAPLLHDKPSAGVFSIAFRSGEVGVVVGGDYLKPSATAGTAAFTLNNGQTWTVSDVSPAGYRSSVAYSSKAKAWLTVGPNGTDISTDDGRSWQPLRPGPGDAPNADKNWNALSLPFVVGPKGRIGILRDAALEGAPGKIVDAKGAK